MMNLSNSRTIYSKKSLLSYFKNKNNHYILLFLKCFAIIWPNKIENGLDFVQFIWNILVRSILTSSIFGLLLNFLFHFPFYYYGEIILFMIDKESVSHIFHHIRGLSSWCIDMIFIFQSFSVLCSLNTISRRLYSVPNEIEIKSYQYNFKFALLYFITSTVPNIVYISYSKKFSQNMNNFDLILIFLLCFSKVIIAGFYAIHMLLVLTDIQVLKTFGYVRKLNNDDNKLVKQKNGKILSQISFRIKSNLYDTLPIILVAFFELIVIVTIYTYDYRTFGRIELYLFVLSIKEILFLFVEILSTFSYLIYYLVYLCI